MTPTSRCKRSAPASPASRSRPRGHRLRPALAGRHRVRFFLAAAVTALVLSTPSCQLASMVPAGDSFPSEPTMSRVSLIPDAPSPLANRSASTGDLSETEADAPHDEGVPGRHQLRVAFRSSDIEFWSIDSVSDIETIHSTKYGVEDGGQQSL